MTATNPKNIIKFYFVNSTNRCICKDKDLNIFYFLNEITLENKILELEKVKELVSLKHISPEILTM